MRDENGNKIKYTTMCIYVDENILKPDADVEKIYKYLVEISRMLAVKRRFFTTKAQYDDFAYYFATIIYNRMTSKRQFLPQDDPKWLSPIKSCLNYMKQIIYGRKCAFCSLEYSETDLSGTSTGYGFDFSQFNPDNGLLNVDINLYFEHIDKLVKSVVNSCVYGKDKLLSYRLYVSVLLSLLKNYTLSNQNKIKVLNNSKIDRVLKEDYDDFMYKLIESETNDSIVTYNLDSIYKNYIMLLVKRIKMLMVDDLKFIINDYSLSSDAIDELLLLSSLSSPGGNT